MTGPHEQHPPYGAPPSYGQPVPAPQAYAQQLPYGYPATPPTNTMAILSVVFCFVFWPLAIVFGFVAKSQIRRTGEGGGTMATIGIAVGFTFLALTLLVVVVAVVVAVGVAGSSSTTSTSISSLAPLAFLR